MVEKVHPREWSMEDRRLSSRCSASRCSAATLSHKAAGIDVATVPPLWLNDPVRSRTVPSLSLQPLTPPNMFEPFRQLRCVSVRRRFEELAGGQFPLSLLSYPSRWWTTNKPTVVMTRVYDRYMT